MICLGWFRAGPQKTNLDWSWDCLRLIKTGLSFKHYANTQQHLTGFQSGGQSTKLQTLPSSMDAISSPEASFPFLSSSRGYFSTSWSWYGIPSFSLAITFAIMWLRDQITTLHEWVNVHLTFIEIVNIRHSRFRWQWRSKGSSGEKGCSSGIGSLCSSSASGQVSLGVPSCKTWQVHFCSLSISHLISPGCLSSAIDVIWTTWQIAYSWYQCWTMEGVILQEELASPHQGLPQLGERDNIEVEFLA